LAGRIFFVLIVATGLVALIAYSQMRTKPNYVSGVVETDQIRLGSRVGGRVQSVWADEGDSVAKGTPLVEFESYDLDERENQALAELAEREAALKKMQAGMRPEEIARAKSKYEQGRSELSLIIVGPRPEEIAAAEDRLSAALSEQQLAQREFDRISELYQNNAVSKSEFDQADEKLKVARSIARVRDNELKILKSGSRKQEIEIAEANVEDLRLAWELAKQGYRAEDIQQARAARDAVAAGLQVIRRQQGELTLTAPTDGVIDALDLQVGDLVAPNAPVLTMLDNDDLWVRAYVPQRFLQLRIGQTLRITIDSFPGEAFQGEVTFISRQAEFTPSNVQTPDERAKQVYRIRVTLQETQKVRPGMTANVWLDSVDGEND
jgi:multidrug resistance efflux pump